MRQTSNRRQTGALGITVFAALITIVIMIVALAIDTGHVALAFTELHNATDAAALAGAQDLLRDFGQIKKRALKVAEHNFADGKPVSNDTPGCEVTVKVTPPDNVSSGKVRVTASMSVRHIFLSLVGLKENSITATSIAGTAGSVSQIARDQAFPIAVSINAVPVSNAINDKPLFQKQLGDTITLFTHKQQVRNAAFTTFVRPQMDLSYLQSAIDQSLGVIPEIPGWIPHLHVGDVINLNAGVVGPQQLASFSQRNRLLAEPILSLPVIQGDPQFRTSAPIVGFISIKVTGINIDPNDGVVESITGKLIKNIVNGKSGQPLITHNVLYDEAISTLSPGVLKLIPRKSEDNIEPSQSIAKAANSL